jgi:hypothetical protein
VSVSVTGVSLAIFMLAIAAWSVTSLAPLHPAQLWALPWSIAVSMYSLRLLPFRPLSWSTTLIAAAATTAFALFSLAGERFLSASRSKQRPGQRADYAIVRSAALAVASLTMVGAFAFVASATVTYGARDTFTASARLRAAIQAGALAIQVKYVYAALAAVALSSMAAGLAAPRRPRLLWLGLAAASAGSTYFATGRATVISALVIAVVAYLTSRALPVRRSSFIAGIGAVAAAALAIFLAGGQLIGKTYANSADIRAVPSVFARHSSLSTFALPYKYVAAPVAALDIQVRSSPMWGDAKGCAELAELCRALGKVNANTEGVSRIRPFTAPPLVWNTYTALDLPLLDGGKALAVPIVALLGFLCGVLWEWSRRRALLGVLVYSIEAAAVVGSPAVFLFTAPHVVGALLIGAVAIWLASGGQAGSVRLGARNRQGDATRTVA